MAINSTQMLYFDKNKASVKSDALREKKVFVEHSLKDV